MKKSLRLYLVVCAALVTSIVTLAACHSSSDSGFFGFGGGTTAAKTFSRGVVVSQNNQQSIDVNGVQFGTGNSSVTVNGNPGASSDLKMGQIVTVQGTASGTNGTALTVVFNNNMTGPITSVSTGSGPGLVSEVTFTLFGQTVKADGNTLFESDDVDLASLQTASVVEVSGLPDGTGTLLATFINTKPTTSDYNVRGVVSNVSGSTFTLAPNGNGNPLTVTLGPGGTITGGTAGGGTVSVTTGTNAGLGTGVTGTTGAGTGGTSGGLLNGQFVNVKIDPATFSPDSTSITAKAVIIEPAMLPQEGDRVFLEGFTTNATGTNAGGNNFQIDGITVNPGSNTVPPTGSRVAVLGTFRSGVLQADLIQPAAGSTLTIGAISSISGTGAATTTGLGTGGTTTGTGAGGTTAGGVQQVSCPAAGTTNVAIQDFIFTPANVTVAANTIVKWTNIGPSQHTVTSTGAAAFNSGILNAGSSVCFRFPAAGIFSYFCSIHPFMTGSVTVTGGTTGSGAGGTSTNATTRTTMVVNGTTFDISGARIKMNGQPATVADLQPGKQVIVKAFSNNFMSVLFPGTTAATGGTAGTTGTSAGAGTGGTGVSSTGTGTTTGATAGSAGAGGTVGSPIYPSGWTGGEPTSTTGTGTGGIGASGTNAGSTTGAGGSGTVTTAGTGTSTGVTVTGTGAGGIGAGIVAKAVTVWIIDNVQGPVTALSGSLTSTASGTLATAPTATLTVFGQTIVVNGTTQFGPELRNLMSSNTGSLAGLDTAGTTPVMDASGIPDNAGDLLATFLETHATATEYHVRGIVSGATGSPLSTFTLTPVPNGTTLTVSLASSATVTNVTDGMTVNVRMDPSTFNAGSTSVTATAVDPVREPLLVEGNPVSAEGVVTDSGAIMTATDMPVDLNSLSVAGLASGTRVLVQGTVSNGSISATRIVSR